jgi:hypothetical protein
MDKRDLLCRTSQEAAQKMSREGLFGQFDKILGLIGFKLFDAGLAAKFDLLSIIDLGDGAAHAVEIVAADEALGEWVRLGLFSGERWLWRGAGC